MMYQDKLVVAIKSNGKILKETKELVQLPYGSEFSILVKNLNSRKVKFKLHIDGTDVLDGTEIIVDANSDVEIKRFIKDGNMDVGNAFKFIERTTQIENSPRGIKVEDGIVRVEFWYEKEKPEIINRYHYDVWPRWRIGDSSYYKTQPFGTYSTNSILRGTSASAATADNVTLSSTSCNSVLTKDSSIDNDVGITVPGSKVEQKFQSVYGFESEVQSHVIILRMTGHRGQIKLEEPVTVKTKNICSTCSHNNKLNAKFCNQCGTSLILL